MGIVLIVLVSLLLAGCGGGDGAAVEARPQSISFSDVPVLNLAGTATVSATASSGLAVRYGTATPDVCTVDSRTGVVTALTPGDCIIAANQSGNTTYAPAPQVTQRVPVIYDSNQTISFDVIPTLSLYSIATVSATASSGLAISSYRSITPDVCTVDSRSGLVTAVMLDDCIIVAEQAGDVNYHEALATQTITVSGHAEITVPGAPAGVTATAENGATVTVSINAVDSGGRIITGYTVSSTPAGITGTAVEAPITVSCPSTCAGYAFSVIATNAVGDSGPSASADVITHYNVIETFYEPDTQPRDSIFVGSFTFNATTSTVLNLQGILSESMTGDLIAYPNDTMTWLALNNQLSSVYDAQLGGLLVTVFLNDTTNTFWGGTWTPEDGVAVGGIYANWPGGENPGNAYAMIFVNTKDPAATLTQAQIDKLAYADCAPGGMMGAACMTGTSVGGYGHVGTMSGYPVSQVITKQP
ncbi:MAG: fibronectin type III domain-containing protein [Gammaproteobacteria bacterium]|nr:fibronectin type III domain-containing protein [Gammaproteobacteria bacterium]